jgi:hypothetical protein
MLRFSFPSSTFRALFLPSSPKHLIDFLNALKIISSIAYYTGLVVTKVLIVLAQKLYVQPTTHPTAASRDIPNQIKALKKDTVGGSLWLYFHNVDYMEG